MRVGMACLWLRIEGAGVDHPTIIGGSGGGTRNGGGEGNTDGVGGGTRDGVRGGTTDGVGGGTRDGIGIFVDTGFIIDVGVSLQTHKTHTL